MVRENLLVLVFRYKLALPVDPSFIMVSNFTIITSQVKTWSPSAAEAEKKLLLVVENQQVTSILWVFLVKIIINNISNTELGLWQKTGLMRSSQYHNGVR